MKHTIIATSLLVLLAFAVSVQAESAFSSLGYGLQQDAHTARSAGLGFASIALPDSTHLDMTHPANWLGVKMTQFSLQGVMTSSSMKDASGSDVSDLSRLAGVAMTIPIGNNQVIGASLTPYTTMKYKWLSRQTPTDGWSTEQLETFEGKGGISQGIVGFSTPLLKGLRIGMAVRGLFGKNEKLWKISFPNESALATSQNISDRYTGVGWVLSSYWQPLPSWSVAASVNSPAKLTVERRSLVNEGTYAIENIKEVLDTKFEIPWDVTFGFAHRMKKHSITFETAWHWWDSIEEPTRIADVVTNGFRFSTGWEWMPEFLAFDPWYEALTYRAGAYWTGNYALSPGGHQPRCFALTGGIGIPYNSDNSRIDLGFQMGWRGSEELDNASETFFKLSLGVSQKELWFINRKERRRK